MGSLVFEAYDGSAPNGVPLGVITEAENKVFTAEWNDLGVGGFTINRNSEQLDWCRADRYIRVYRNSVEEPPIGGFWVQQSGDTVVSTEEEGGEASNRTGLGPMQYLTEAIVWHTNTTTNDSAVPGANTAFWQWKGLSNVHAAGILIRMLEEAKARGALPDLSWDFTRQRDSNGVLWSLEIEDFQLPVGMNLLEVLRKVQETGVEFYMDHDLLLHAYEPGSLGEDLSSPGGSTYTQVLGPGEDIEVYSPVGETLTHTQLTNADTRIRVQASGAPDPVAGPVTFEKGVDIATSAERRVAASPLKSTTLVKGRRTDNGEIAWITRTPAYALAETGRRKEGFIDAPETTGGNALRAMADTQTSRDYRWKAGPTLLGVVETEIQVAFVDYVPGDVVTVIVPGTFEAVAKKLTSISLTDTESGEYDVTVGFDEDPGREGTPPSDGGVTAGSSGGGGGGKGPADRRPCSDCPPLGPFVPVSGDCAPASYSEIAAQGSSPGGHGHWMADARPVCVELAMRVQGTFQVSAATGYPYTESSGLLLNVWDTFDPMFDYFAGSPFGEVTLAPSGPWSVGSTTSFDKVTAKNTATSAWSWINFADLGGDWVLAAWDDPLFTGHPSAWPGPVTEYRVWRDGQWSPAVAANYEVSWYDPASGDLAGGGSSPSYNQSTTEVVPGGAVAAPLTTNYPYTPDSLEVTVNGVGVVPTQTDPAAGTFTLPVDTTGATVLATYQVGDAGSPTGAANSTTLPTGATIVPYGLLGTGGDGSGANTLTDAGTWVATATPAADTHAWMPLTTVVGGVPELVWDADDSLIPTLVPLS